jgi:hypothetical protein
MKKCIYLSIILFIIISGCSNKKREIDELIQGNKFEEAQAVLNNLSKEEKQEPKIKEIQATIYFHKFLISLKKLEQQNDYHSVDSLIDSNIPNYKTYSKLADSLLNIRKEYSFKGAEYYSSKKKYAQAYQCVINYASDNNLDGTKRQIVNNLKMNAISGMWYGKMIAGRMKVQMRIDPVGSTTFTGRVLFEEMGILSELNNGTFDGVNITATYPIRITRYREIMKGVTGIYNNGILTMKFPVVITITSSGTDGGYGSYTTSEPRIFVKECVMSKKKF